MIQWMMGWESGAMVARYAGHVRAEVAAERLPLYAPI